MLAKLITWLSKNGMAICGILQAIVKLAKEIATLVIDILLPIIPGDKFDDVVYKVRDFINVADGMLQKAKDFLERIGG